MLDTAVPPNTTLKSDRAYAALVNVAVFHISAAVVDGAIVEKARRFSFAVGPLLISYCRQSKLIAPVTRQHGRAGITFSHSLYG